MKKKLLCVMLIFCFILGQIKVNTIAGATTLTERKFIVLMMKKAKLCPSKSSTAQVLKKAYMKKILYISDKKYLSKKLTRVRAAILLNRVDVKKNGSSYDKKLYQRVLKYHRISDLKSIKKSDRAKVIKVYCKGIMTGNSNGYYVQSRKFKGSKKVNPKEANTYIARLCSKKKRQSISPDGQLIRKSNLPKNAKSYPYILTTYPKSFYEKTFEYQKTKFYKTPVPLVDFASPVQMKQMKFYDGTSMEKVMNKYLLSWCNKVKTNIQLRFNVDYRTINNTWVKKLRKTYYDFGDDRENKERTDDIKAYVRKMKSNKVIVKAARVTVEPSSLYFCNVKYLRVYVKFKIKCKNIESNSLVYSDEFDVKNLRKEKWISKCFDIGIGSYNGSSHGKDYVIVDNKLLQA